MLLARPSPQVVELRFQFRYAPAQEPRLLSLDPATLWFEACASSPAPPLPSFFPQPQPGAVSELQPSENQRDIRPVFFAGRSDPIFFARDTRFCLHKRVSLSRSDWINGLYRKETENLTADYLENDA